MYITIGIFFFSSNGCDNSLSTYSLVAGIWSCMYSLGEVTGPALGGLLLQHTGFPTASSTMAATCFVLVSYIWTTGWKETYSQNFLINYSFLIVIKSCLSKYKRILQSLL